jgi:hypothetical protein
MRRLPILLILIGGSLILGNPVIGGDKKTSPNYYPLKEGSKWYYRIDIPGQPAQNAIVHLAKIEKIDGVALGRLETSLKGTVTTTEHISSDETGIFRHRFNGVPTSKPLCLLKYPVKPGETWQQEITIGTEKVKSMCKVGQEEEVQVPAGKFKAIPVQIDADANGMKVATTYWFAADVGVVKQIAEFSGVKITLELEKREVGK